MNLKLSFVVPFYNVEKYIGACLDSLYTQNIPEEDYEVICVDDCSSDNSKNIVQEYRELRDNLILIEHDKNQGLGVARNTGLKHARGRYVWFIDSDDYIKTQCGARLLDLCLKNNLDVLLFNYQRVDDFDTVLDIGLVFSDTDVLSGIEYVHGFFQYSFTNHLGYVWRCLYRKDYLFDNTLFFPKYAFWEDTVFFPKSVLMAQKVQSVSEIVYNYRTNSNSISGRINKYKADRVFQFAFFAGKDLLSFSKEFEKYDRQIASDLEKKSYWYFNSFTKPLSLSPFKEKRSFYKLIKQYQVQISEIRKFLILRNRMLLVPYLGFVISSLMKPLYSIKEKRKIR